jgi:hypothetical protein
VSRNVRINTEISSLASPEGGAGVSVTRGPFADPVLPERAVFD